VACGAGCAAGGGVRDAGGAAGEGVTRVGAGAGAGSFGGGAADGTSGAASDADGTRTSAARSGKKVRPLDPMSGGIALHEAGVKYAASAGRDARRDVVPRAHEECQRFIQMVLAGSFWAVVGA
jgi:hypothetical protein